MSPYSIEILHAGAGPGGLEGAGPGLGSATSWAIALIVVVLLCWHWGGGAPPEAAAEQVAARGHRGTCQFAMTAWRRLISCIRRPVTCSTPSRTKHRAAGPHHRPGTATGP